MFVFKAAVVGAGTMGGQIAQTIAAAGIPVVLKDVKQELVDAGLDRGPQRHRRARSAGSSRRASSPQEQADAQVEEIVGRIHGTTTYDGFGDVDFVDRGRARADGDQAGRLRRARRRARPGHAILASNTSSLSITEIGDATLRPDKVVGFHYFYPASVMPLIEIVEGDDTSAGDGAGGASPSPRRSRSSRSPAPRSRASSSTASSTRASREVWRAQEEQGLSIKKIDEGVGAAERRADGAVLPRQPARPRHRAARRRAPRTSPTATASTSPRACSKLVAEGKLGAKTGGDGFYDAEGEPEPRGRRRPRRRRARRAADAEDVRRGLPGARGGRRDPPRHRLRDDGRRRPGPAPRPAAAVHEGRRRGPRHGPRAPGERRRSSTASASRRRRSCAAWSPRAASGTKTGQGFYAYPQPDAEQPGRGVVKLETRGDVAIAWLANGQMNSISPQVIERPAARSGTTAQDARRRARS